jgi:hypothetical protein
MRRNLALALLLSASTLGALWLAPISGATPEPPAIVTGIDAGWSDVRGWNANGSQARQWAPWGEWPLVFSPYPTYQNGVRVAVGDVNGDGHAEIMTAPGTSAFTELKVFDGRSFQQLKTLLPFKDAVWWAGAFVSTGDTNGDGRADVVEGLAPGCCTTLHVIDAVSGDDRAGWFPFGDHSEVGARVASGDVSGDGRAEVIAEAIGTSRIQIYAPSGGSPLRTIDAFSSAPTGPTTIAAGNLLGDARDEIVAAAPTAAGIQVNIIDVASGAIRASLFPYGAEAATAVELATGDVNGDGHADVVTAATTPAGTEVRAVDTDGHDLGDFYVLDPPGVSVAAGDLDGDGRAEIVLGSGPTNTPWPPTVNGPDQRVSVYEVDGTAVGRFTAYPGVFQGGVRVALADLSGDRRPEMVTAPGVGMEPELDVFTQEYVNGRDRGNRLAHFLAFDRGFLGGVSVATGDVDGNGHAEIVAAAGPGHSLEVRLFAADGTLLRSFLAFGADYTGGLSVAAGDLNADGRAEIVVGTLAGPARIRTFAADGTQFGPLIAPFGPSAYGVEVGVADIAGDGHGLVLAGSASGSNPRLAVIDPVTGATLRAVDVAMSLANGIRVAGGDLNTDGHDEIVVTPGFGGDSRVHIYNGALDEIGGFPAYDWVGAGMNVALTTRIGLPVTAMPRTVKLTARKPARVVVASFHDAAGGTRAGVHAFVNWGDGTSVNAKVLVRGGGLYDVRGLKRYGHAGRYAVTVTFSDDTGRISIAHSRAIVARRR